MTRILSYNIWLGGTRRVDQLATMILSTKADVVGLVEATNPQVVEELARRLNMQFRLSERGAGPDDWQLGVLSRLPIIHTQVHTYPNIFTRQHLLEVRVQEADGKQLTVFVTHLTANFFRGRESNLKRRREVEGILQIMQTHQGTPHLVMGDFNSLAPGENFKASALLRYFHIKRHPVFSGPHRRNKRGCLRYLIGRLLHLGIYNDHLSPLTDSMSRFYMQGGIDLLYKAGYIDCFRQIHPHAQGFTFHTAMPSGRIDYIFASPELAQRLLSCDVITAGNDIHSSEASDHMPVCAEFG